MEPFTVRCTTCRALLKVRDSSAIGQILACPKCGSMVLVEAPSGGQAPEAKTPAQVAPSRESAVIPRRSSQLAPAALPIANTFDEAAALLADDAAPPAESVTAGPAPTSVAPQSPPPSANVSAAGTLVTPVPSEPESAAMSDAAAASSPLLPTAAWTSPLVRRWQQWALMGTGSAAGVVLAVIAVGLVIRFQMTARDRHTPAGGAGSTVSRAEEQAGSDASNSSGSANPGGASNAAAADSHDAHDDESTDNGATAGSEKSAGDATGSGINEAPVAGTPPEDGSSTTDETARADSSRTDQPPDLEPAGDGLGAGDGAPKSLPFLDELSRLAPPIDAAPADEPGLALDDAADDESTIGARPEPPRVDVAARLADPVTEIEFRDTPLGSLIRLMTNLSTIPISVDWDALARAKATVAMPISLHLRDTTVGGVLEAALEPYALGVDEEEGHLVVTSIKRDDEARVARYNVADLAAGDADAPQRLADLVVAFVAPQSWEAAGGEGTIAAEGDSLAVAQTGDVQFQVALLLDRLRVARGLPPRGDFLRPQLATVPRAESARDRLAAPVTANHFLPTPLVQILARLENQAGVRFVVDWRAAAKVGWSPQAEATLTANGQPLGEALVAMLAPMDLTYRVIDESTLEITTAEGLSAGLECELYPVSDLVSESLTNQQLVESLSAAMGRHWLRGGAGGAIYFDEPSRCLLVSLPPSAHAHLSRMIDALRDKHR